MENEGPTIGGWAFIALIMFTLLASAVWLGASFSDDTKFDIWLRLTQCMPWDDTWGTIFCTRG